MKALRSRTYKKPDLNKPRFRDTKFAQRLISKELYAAWKVQYPQFAKRVPDVSSFKRLWKKIVMKYIHYAVHNSMGVRLPFYCGDVSVQFINIEYEAYDAKKSRQINEAVPHLNWGTRDRLAKIVWSIGHACKFNKYLPFLAFKANEVFVRQTHHALVENPNIYKTAKSH